MPTPPIEATWNPGSFEPPPLRFRAEWPTRPRPSSDAARHDFLVPILWPDVAAVTDPHPEPREHRRYLDPDSMFWSPASHSRDTA